MYSILMRCFSLSGQRKQFGVANNNKLSRNMKTLHKQTLSVASQNQTTPTACPQIESVVFGEKKEARVELTRAMDVSL